MKTKIIVLFIVLALFLSNKALAQNIELDTAQDIYC